MNDREKVIKAIENAKKQSVEYAQDYILVPLRETDMILTLLKEQEPTRVIQSEAMHMLFWCCGSCGVAITDGDKFCRNCGRAVKWDATD